MPKYTIYWDIGFGENTETVYAANFEEACDMAYCNARENFENTASYGAIESGDIDEE